MLTASRGGDDMGVGRVGLVLLGFCFVGVVVAQKDGTSLRPAPPQDNSKWETVARTENITWDAQPASLTIAQRGDVRSVMVVGQVHNHATGRLALFKWYVPVSDCEPGMGQVFTVSIDDDFRFKSDFVFGGSSASSGLAEYLCASTKSLRRSRSAASRSSSDTGNR